MKQTILLLFSIAILSFSCASSSSIPSSKSASQTEEPENPKPSWVKERPTSSLYYIGIASTNKRIFSQNYQEATYEKALRNLGSEIKVNLKSNSVLSTTETNHSFKETYKSTVNTNVEVDLEGYELVDTWENETHFWAYYQLNKMTYAEIQEKKRRVARQKALTYFESGEEYKEKRQYAEAIASYCDALIPLEPYILENNTVTREGKSLDITNAIFSNAQTILNDIEIIPHKENYNFKKSSSTPTKIEVKVKSKTYGNLLQSIPLSSSFISGKGSLSEKNITDISGNSFAEITDFTSDQSTTSLIIQTNNMQFSQLSSENALIKTFLGSLKESKRIIEVNILESLIFIRSIEKNLGNDIKYSKPLQNGAQESLAKNGFKLTKKIAEADLILDIEANTRKGNENNGMFFSYLDAQLSLKDKQGKTINVETISNIKGVQLSFEKAGIDAYKKSKSVVDKKIKKLL